ncbi:hypothetical protein GOC69_12265 [Sinorhizobium medicae]|nr:hypothetical protein [Sinorhizobium medicae]MDX0475218.1 hypothetical protein [Sinorhizobium medicae]
MSEAKAKRRLAIAKMIIAEIKVAESIQRMEDAESQSAFVPDPTRMPFPNAAWHHQRGWILEAVGGVA